jgi:hypothetical protein
MRKFLVFHDKKIINTIEHEKYYDAWRNAMMITEYSDKTSIVCIADSFASFKFQTLRSYNNCRNHNCCRPSWCYAFTTLQNVPVPLNIYNGYIPDDIAPVIGIAKSLQRGWDKIETSFMAVDYLIEKGRLIKFDA